MYMDEAAIFAGPFIFISYSHKDAAVVREDAEKLIEQGVRIWIDHRSDDMENIHLSDNWFQKVQTAIMHPNCRAVVFYVSPYALASKAIQREQRLVRDRTELPYWCVSVDGAKISKQFKKAMSLCDDEDSPWYNEDYFTGGSDVFSEQTAMFNDEKMSILREDSDECVGMIYTKIAVPFGAVDHAGAAIQVLESHNVASRDTGEITLGIYKGARCEPVAGHSENARFTFRERQYIHHNGEFFTGRPLRWQLMYIKDACAVLICTEILEKGPFTGVQEFLSAFDKLAFTPAEAETVRKVRLMNAEDAAAIDPERQDVLDLDISQENMYWWIDQVGALDAWRITYKNDHPVRNGFLVTRPKGYRPVIEVGIEDLKNINGG